MRRFTLGSIITATLLLSGCGGGGSSSNDSTPEAPKATTNETPTTISKGIGHYVDSAVEGVEYICGDTTGVTDENGTFTFEENKNCTFSLGDVKLREVNASSLSNDMILVEDDVAVARFLQSLDSDGNAENGIKIDNSTKEVLSTKNVTTIPTSDDDVADVVIAMQSNSEYQGQMVTEQDAQIHIDQTKADLNGNSNVQMTSVVGISSNGRTSNSAANGDGSSTNNSHNNFAGSMGVNGSSNGNSDSSTDSHSNLAGSMSGNGSSNGDSDSSTDSHNNFAGATSGNSSTDTKNSSTGSSSSDQSNNGSTDTKNSSTGSTSGNSSSSDQSSNGSTDTKNSSTGSTSSSSSNNSTTNSTRGGSQNSSHFGM